MEFENDKINEAYKEKNIRGFIMSIPDQILSDIIGKAMGLEKGALLITHVGDGTHFKGFTISAVSANERFPKLSEGEMFPHLRPIIKQRVVTYEEGEAITEIYFDGFEVEA